MSVPLLFRHHETGTKGNLLSAPSPAILKDSVGTAGHRYCVANVGIPAGPGAAGLVLQQHLAQSALQRFATSSRHQQVPRDRRFAASHVQTIFLLVAVVPF